MFDFDLIDHGSVTVLKPLTPEAETWVADNLPDDRLEWFGGAVIEPRYVGDILAGIEAEGLTVH